MWAYTKHLQLHIYFWPWDGITNCLIHFALKTIVLNVKIGVELQRLKVKTLPIYLSDHISPIIVFSDKSRMVPSFCAHKQNT